MNKIKFFKNFSSRLKFNYKLSNKTWFGTGGKAKYYFTPLNEIELSLFLKFIPKSIPIFMIGLGSNIIIRDGGFNGVVIKLGEKFKFIDIDYSKKTFSAGCASKDLDLSYFCMNNSITGFEFLVGIPGSLGGSLRMNAGCFNQSISDKLISVRVMDRSGKIHILLRKQINFEYRKSLLPDDWFFLDATFQIEKKNKNIIRKNMNKIKEKRKFSQPINMRTGGSTFKNIDKKKAWKLIDEVGFRGYKFGSAQVSGKHTNFLINTGKCKSLELELLGEKIKERVFERKGIKLEWEIKRIGDFVKV